MKNNKGITLVALVITIIVLLILAGVSISMVVGDNGVLTRAKNAATETTKAQAREDLEEAITSFQTSEETTKKISDGVYTESSTFFDDLLNTDTQAKIILGDGYTVAFGTKEGAKPPYFTATVSKDSKQIGVFYVVKSGTIGVYVANEAPAQEE